MKRILFLVLAIYTSVIWSQEYFPKNDGVKSEESNFIAFTNARIQVDPDKSIDQGILLIRKGRIEAVGKNVSIPENTVIYDLEGKTVYPSFIDVYSGFGIDLPKAESSRSRGAQYDSKRSGYYWNEHIMPEQDPMDKFEYDKKASDELLKSGFGVVNTHIQDGIARGNGILVALTEESNGERILDKRSGQYFSFSKSKYNKQIYPSSLMGSMALLKQMYLDAAWYGKGNSKTSDLSLEALNRNKDLVQIFEAGSKTNALRANSIASDSGQKYVLLGGGDEYELIEDIKNTGATFILPLDFPKPFDVEDPFQARYVTLSDMRDWNQAPSNPAAFQKSDITFAFTTKGLKSLKDFKKNLKKAMSHGLEEKTALAALTTVPAQILGKSDQLGTLQTGAYANFIITSGNIFDDNTQIFENWVLGKRNEFLPLQTLNILGSYDMSLDNEKYDLQIAGNLATPKATVKRNGKKLNAKMSFKNNWMHLYFHTDSTKTKSVRLSSLVQDPNRFEGNAVDAAGREMNFVAEKKESPEKKQKKQENYPSSAITFPNNAYGFKEKPKQETILFKNVTLWTNEEDGIVEGIDVLVEDGVISKIGKDLKSGRARVIDGTDKHLTSGIIDEHSHIATVSTNEVGHNSTAEVTMEEGLNYEDVNIYRNLAGGVTQAQILHGSANPIGGRSAIIKLKWGETAENLIDRKAPKFIKFALGENVKQSNWNSGGFRFPQTRMGVEQVFEDYFQRARDYDKLAKSGNPFRRDIEMEVIAEILNGERFISCHSYVQSEINMLMKVAERFDFKVNTFTHILEGYKVADKMREHGVAGSTFSDWWAYKFEVNDAIPYNAAIMHSQGVLTAINSDDAEMSRRLNQEAAKTIKYGGVSEEDAWKMVTLNPAKMLHIDDRVGSVKVGKEADLVLWSDHPLSVQAKAEKTMIEGVIYFDLERDSQMREEIKKEKNALIQLMLQEKMNGSKTREPQKKENRLNHCDTVDF